MTAMYGSHEHRFAGMAWFGAGGMRISWGGVLAGVAVAAGTAMLLATMSVAIGLTDREPGALGLGATLWIDGQLLVALFAGGMAAARSGATIDRTSGFLEGVLVWVLSVAVMAYLGSGGVATVARGAFGAIAAATDPSTIVMQSAAGFAAAPAAGAQPIGAVTERLRSPQLVEHVVSLTGMSADEARRMLVQAAERLETQRPAPGVAADDAARGREQVIDRVVAAQDAERPARDVAGAWLKFAVMLASLAAAVAGAIVGRRRSLEVVATSPSLR